MAFPYYKQIDSNDCGLTCYQSICDYYSIDIDFDEFRLTIDSSFNGLSLASLTEIGKSLGFKCSWYKLDIISLIENFTSPVIVNLSGNHYVIVYKVSQKKVYVSDPAFGLIKYSIKDFSKLWLWNSSEMGLCMECISPKAYEKKNWYTSLLHTNFNFGLFNYLLKEVHAFKFDFIVMFFLVFVTSLLQFAFPIISQRIVDNGIENKDFNLVLLFAGGYFFIFLGRRIFDFFRSYFMNKLMLNFNYSLINKFITKLISMPFTFFQSNQYSDLIVKLRDVKRIQKLATQASIDSFFSVITVFVFSLYLLYYSYILFLLVFIFYMFYFYWILKYFNKRKLNDYLSFNDSSNEQMIINDVLYGIIDIKLTGSLGFFENSWKNVQASVVKNGLSKFRIEEGQDFGSSIIKEFFFALITLVSAYYVIFDKFSIGVYFSVQYVLGNLSAPIYQLLNFLTTFQDSKLSFDRIRYITEYESNFISQPSLYKKSSTFISIVNLSYRYSINDSFAIKDLNISLPSNSKIAIVGESGSGKSTFVKLMLGFFSNYEGEIYHFGNNLKDINVSRIYESIGVVNQEGHLFNTSILNNIVLDIRDFNLDKFYWALRIVEFYDFVYSLDQKENTIIGDSGMKLSGGQKQKILIARSIYKSPDILFFDEATSSLDSVSEASILFNISSNFPQLSFIFVTHRVNLVRDFDMILVFKDSKLSCFGSHHDLISSSEYYRQLNYGYES